MSLAGVFVPLFPTGYLAWRCWNGNARAVMLAVLAAELLFLAIDSAYVSVAGILRRHSRDRPSTCASRRLLGANSRA